MDGLPAADPPLGAFDEPFVSVYDDADGGAEGGGGGGAGLGVESGIGKVLGPAEDC